jgi:hypothetical protein
MVVSAIKTADTLPIGDIANFVGANIAYLPTDAIKTASVRGILT